MSKSLKNFITIREALKECSPRQLRLLFLLKPWHKIMNYKKFESTEEAKTKEKIFTEFFIAVKNITREESDISSAPQAWTKSEKDLHKVYLLYPFRLICSRAFFKLKMV